jgi:hypothetical protein
MSDTLKIFISEHRNAIDTAVPDAHHWKGLARVLDRLPEADELERHILCDRILLDTAAPSNDLWTKITHALDCQKQEADPLECFIREHREALDTAQPGQQIWANISQQITAEPTRKTKVVFMGGGWQRNLLRAAAAIALLMTGIGLGMWFSHSQIGPLNQGGMAMSEVSTEYAELEDYYQRDIESKKQQLAHFTSNSATDLEGDLLQMDKNMQELRAELANVPPGNREQVVRAMIENYKAKASILQRVLEHLQEIELPATQPKSSKNDTERI